MPNIIDDHPLIKAYRSSTAAWERQTQQQWAAAAAEFQAMSRSRGDSSELAAAEAFCAGQAARKIGFYEQAVRDYSHACDMLPHWPLPLEGLAASYYRIGSRSEVENLLNRALKLDGGLTQSRLLFAELLCERNNYKAAEDVLKLGINYHHGDAGFHCRLGHIALSDGRMAEAEQWYKRALTLNSSDSEAYTGLSSIRIVEQKYNDALDCIKRALENDERAAGALINRGVIHYIFNQPIEGEAAFDRAVKISPRSAQINFRLGIFYWKQNNTLKAERFLRLAINSEPLRSYYHSALALLLLGENRLNEAEQHYRHALRFNPEDVIALHGLSTLALIDSNNKNAEPLIARAHTLLSEGKRDLTKKLVVRLHPKLKPKK